MEHYRARPNYRPDVDGLRAIAVLSVVIFHAFPSKLSGGFIGVDIFFVISGFLISSIIFDRLSNGTFNIYEFYTRRIKRIFPALLVVLSACLIFGWFALFSAEYMQLGKHALAGAGFVSNLVLWREDGYFEQSAELKPLLHLWSLGIEEQFYIIWPLLLWMASRFGLNIPVVLILLTIFSFVLNIESVKTDEVATFYAPYTRFWELMCGGILAWFGSIIRACYPARLSAIADNVTSFLGLSLLAYGFFSIKEGSRFPGFWAVVPVLGAMLVISAGADAWINRKILANQFLVWFGLISFPLYLWHWPLLCFATIMENGVPNDTIRIVIVMLSMVLAWFTYRFIECPIRFDVENRVNLIFLVGLMFCVAGFGYSIFLSGGLKSRSSVKAIEAMLVDKIEPSETRTSDGSCERLLNFTPAEHIVCLSNTDVPNVLIIGDSHAMALNSAAMLGRVDIPSMLISAHGCLPLVGYVTYKEKSGPSKGCDQIISEVVRALDHNQSIKTIVVATRGPFYFTGEDFPSGKKSLYSIISLTENQQMKQTDMFIAGYSGFISKLMTFDVGVVFVTEVPELAEHPNNCVASRPLTLTDKPLSFCQQSRDVIAQRQAVYRQMISKFKHDYPRLEIYDSSDVFCDNATCYGIRDGRVLYWDDDHISLRGSEIILSDMIQKGYIASTYL